MWTVRQHTIREYVCGEVVHLAQPVRSMQQLCSYELVAGATAMGEEGWLRSTRARALAAVVIVYSYLLANGLSAFQERLLARGCAPSVDILYVS